MSKNEIIGMKTGIFFKLEKTKVSILKKHDLQSQKVVETTLKINKY